VAILELLNLGQIFGEQAILIDVNLEIQPGEIFVLIGPTGAGKTTLLRIIDLLDQPTSGQIYFNGTEVTRSKPLRQTVRRRMSYVQQKPVVFTMSVYDNIACGLKWRGEKSENVRRKVDKVLKLVGMEDYRDRNAKTLSGGETQRVAIARALVTEPQVLLLDEPTANLDPVSVSKIEEVLAHVIEEWKITVIMATHDMSQGQRLARRIGVLVTGRLLQVGSPEEVFTVPQTKEVAELIGVGNILSGVIVARDDNLVTVDVKGNTVEAVADYESGEKVFVLIRPEDITLSLSKELSSARNTFTGKIVRMASAEPLVRVEIDGGFPLLALVTKKSAAELGLTIGKLVYGSAKASAIRVIRRWH
jgi:tungstate transport system ATP-binding protein